MGIGPGPGETYKTECTNKSEHTAAFSGDITIAISGTPKQIEYYELNKSYVWHARPFDGDKPDVGDSQESSG